MTENKRFILKENGIIDDTQLNILLDGGEDKEDMVDLLNELSDENKQLKQQLSEQGTQIDFLKDENHHMKHVLNENKQLKQRNNRQAKQLDRLYNLIEEKDWRTLTDIIDDFKQCEEQLQREMRCYK